MAGALLAVSLVMAYLVAAVVILAARDARRHRLQQERRPVADRIGAICADAAFMVNELRSVLDRRSSPESKVAWIAPVIAYYRRLEVLAADSNASVEEIQRLAKEAGTYIRQHRLKGICVAQQAEQLTVLVRRRDVA